jgi:hypothetical protein
MTRSRHGRLESFAVQIDHCTPFRLSQFPVLIAQAESQMWRSATDEGLPQGNCEQCIEREGRGAAALNADEFGAYFWIFGP